MPTPSDGTYADAFREIIFTPFDTCDKNHNLQGNLQILAAPVSRRAIYLTAQNASNEATSLTTSHHLQQQMH